MKRRSNQRGFALLFAIVLLAVVSVLSTLLVSLLSQSRHQSAAAAERGVLANVADSGAELAISKLAQDADWTGGEDLAVPGGRCSIAVRGLPDGGREIASKTQARDRVCVVTTKVFLQTDGRCRVTGWTVEQHRLPNQTGTR